jgi:hypothetical protein
MTKGEVRMTLKRIGNGRGKVGGRAELIINSLLGLGQQRLQYVTLDFRKPHPLRRSPTLNLMLVDKSISIREEIWHLRHQQIIKRNS